MASSSEQTFNSVERAVIDALANNSDDVDAAGQQIMILFQRRTSKQLFKTSAAPEDNFANRISLSDLVSIWMFASHKENLQRTFNVFLSLRFCPKSNVSIVKIFRTQWPPLVQKIIESYLFGGTFPKWFIFSLSLPSNIYSNYMYQSYIYELFHVVLFFSTFFLQTHVL